MSWICLFRSDIEDDVELIDDDEDTTQPTITTHVVIEEVA